MKRGPSSQLILVVSEEFDFLWSYCVNETWRTVGVNSVDFFAVVLLAVDERDEKLARFSAKHVLKYPRVEIVFEHAVVPHGMQTIDQKTRVAAAGNRLTG